MAKLRLNMTMREILRNNAEKHILPQKLKVVYDAAYEAVKPLVRKAVESAFKPAEMAVLHRFECATTANSARFHYPNGAVQQFDWRFEEDADALPLVPDTSAYQYGNKIYQADQKLADLIEAWVMARDAYIKEHNKRRDAYHALIQGANYLEDLLDVWPEAATMIPRTSGAIIALGPDQVEAVKRDLEEQRKAAKGLDAA